MGEESKELSQFLRSTLEAIRAGIPSGYDIQGPIEFELAVITTKGVRGGFNIFVADARGRYNKEEISKIRLTVGKLKVPDEDESRLIDTYANWSKLGPAQKKKLATKFSMEIEELRGGGQSE